MIHLEKHNGITVLRDDLLPGGTKSRLVKRLLDYGTSAHVYASPAAGGFQVALAAKCAELGRQAVIFTAKRQTPHRNTLLAKEYGARVFQVQCGYLSVVQARAREYAEAQGAQLLKFGADTPEAIEEISFVMREVTAGMGKEPDEVWCAVGSGTLAKGIVKGTATATVNGVQVGKAFAGRLDRFRLHSYPMKFEKATKFPAPFPSQENYDRKAWEFCMKKSSLQSDVLFWNVFG